MGEPRSSFFFFLECRRVIGLSIIMVGTIASAFFASKETEARPLQPLASACGLYREQLGALRRLGVITTVMC